jgi:hypothetical protein
VVVGSRLVTGGLVEGAAGVGVEVVDGVALTPDPLLAAVDDVDASPDDDDEHAPRTSAPIPSSTSRLRSRMTPVSARRIG